MSKQLSNRTLLRLLCRSDQSADLIADRIEELQRENAALRQQLEDVKRVRYSLEDAVTRAHDEAEACWEDKERLDWIALRKSTQFVYFAVAGWAIIKASGCDLLHECNIHDLRAAIDAARAKEAKP